MSDAVQLVIVTGIVGIATMIIKGFIDANAKKVEVVAAAEAAKVAQKLAEVEIKIDGRLTQLLEITKKAALAEGKIEGKAEEKEKHITAEATVVQHPLGADADLKITGGEIKITTETKKKK